MKPSATIRHIRLIHHTTRLIHFGLFFLRCRRSFFFWFYNDAAFGWRKWNEWMYSIRRKKSSFFVSFASKIQKAKTKLNRSFIMALSLLTLVYCTVEVDENLVFFFFQWQQLLFIATHLFPFQHSLFMHR